MRVKDQKTYTAEDLLAAKLQGRLQGRKEAEEYLQRRIDNVCKTNYQLLVEIMWLDRTELVAGVFIPYS